jgi:hypothetical protein
MEEKMIASLTTRPDESGGPSEPGVPDVRRFQPMKSLRWKIFRAMALALVLVALWTIVVFTLSSLAMRL